MPCVNILLLVTGTDLFAGLHLILTVFEANRMVDRPQLEASALRMTNEAQRRPRTIAEWRHPPQSRAGDPLWNPRVFWDQLNLGDLFLSRGYRLWPPQEPCADIRFHLEPAKDWPYRVFDGFAYRSPYSKSEFKGQFDMGVVGRLVYTIC
jgi:hypothetical protein